MQQVTSQFSLPSYLSSDTHTYELKRKRRQANTEAVVACTLHSWWMERSPCTHREHVWEAYVWHVGHQPNSHSTNRLKSNNIARQNFSMNQKSKGLPSHLDSIFTLHYTTLHYTTPQHNTPAEQHSHDSI